ncbi:MAG TPA: biopolymer transporter ExbD [Dongiaceae bacterium]|nr:biopolymer transporter ExbD [Dongiaceae bacterium]
MKYVLEVCLLAFATTNFAPSTATAAPAQSLQQGISVELAPTHSASPMPDADSEDAFIVTVTANSSVYLGINSITLPELALKTRSTPFKRGHAIYIKADARTPCATVLQVLQATSSGGMIPQVLLTNQPPPSESDRVVPPQGLDVSVSPLPAGSVATVVQLLASVQESTLLRVNNDPISWPALESTLTRHFQKGDDKLVLLRADPRLPFADVVHAIDGCRAAGAKIYLAGL